MNINHVIVLGYGKDDAHMHRMWPYWHALGCDVQLRCPIDDPSKVLLRQFLYGSSSYGGPNALARTVAAMQEALCLKGDHFVFQETDNLFLGHESIKPRAGLQCILSKPPVDNKYRARKYHCNFPWTLDRESIERLLEAYNKFPAIVEDYWVDRWIAALAEEINLPVFDYQPFGFSVDTIKLENIQQLVAAIWKGCTVFHGVKREWELEFILDERRQYLSRDAAKSFYVNHLQ